jgi:hypothetical protein
MNIIRNIVEPWLRQLRQQKKFTIINFYCNLITRQKTVWNIVKSITNNKATTNSIPFVEINNNISYNPQTIANACNLYFSSVAENFSGGITTNNKNPISYLHQNFMQTFSKIQLRNTTTHEVEKIIYSLKSKHSHGYDEISSRILKASTSYVSSPLTYIFNKILQTGEFPDRLKFSEVKPLYKKGDKTQFSNYRPFSLLPTFSKIIEKIIYKRLYSHLNENNILVAEQFGFRENLNRVFCWI